MKKTAIHLLFAITLLTSFVACEKKTDDVSAPKASENDSTAKIVVAEVKEDLKEIASKAEAEAKEVVASVKEASAENLEVAKKKVAEIKEEAAEEMAEIVEAADAKIDDAGATLKDAKKDAAKSLNNMFQSEGK